MDTLTSAYHHLSQISEPRPEQIDLLQKVEIMVERFKSGALTIADDNFILARLSGQVACLNSSVPPAAGPTPNPLPSQPPVARGMPAPACGREEDFGEIASEVDADRFVDALYGWINEIVTLLTKTGAKGEGLSGLASAPSVRRPVGRVTKLVTLLGDRTRVEALLAQRFWHSFGAHADLRMALSCLAIKQSSAQSVLDKAERTALEDTLFALDVAYLRSLLVPLSGHADECLSDAFERNEDYGKELAKSLRVSLQGLPLSAGAGSSGKEEEAAAQLAAARSVLKKLSVELRVGPPSAVVRGFLEELLSGEMLRLAQLV